jgi:hypothetical protein
VSPVADRAEVRFARLGARIGARLGLTGRGPAVVTSVTILGLALLGSGLFGLIHVVGGTLHGNGRAASFGVELAVVSAVLLGALAWVLRRTAMRR